MTAIEQRRTRSTWMAFVAAVVALAATVVLGVAGFNTLADSTVGKAADTTSQPPVLQRLPFTSTALLGVADEDGRLTSIAVGVLEPDGTGGSIVQLAATADPSSANGVTSTPLWAVLELDGPIAFREAAERLTGLSFDVIEVADDDRFVQWVTPLGDLSAQLTIDVADASSGAEWSAGEQVLTGPGAARLVTASDDAVADWYLEPARAAVWSAIADRVGAGIGSAVPVADDELDVPGTVDEFLGRLYAGPVSFHALQSTPIEGDELSARFDPAAVGLFGAAEAIVVHDRAELLMVFGAIAPARMGAPIDAPTVRIVSGLTPDDTAAIGWTPADVMKSAVAVLAYSRVNVVSVVDAGDGSAPDVTRVRVADPAIAERFEEVYGEFLGALDVTVAAVAIEGIDVEISLGRSVLVPVADGAADAAAIAGTTTTLAESSAEG